MCVSEASNLVIQFLCMPFLLLKFGGEHLLLVHISEVISRNLSDLLVDAGEPT
jgi:hypothetical protein